MALERGDLDRYALERFGTLAEPLRRNGWDVFPAQPASKVPAVQGWNRRASARRVAGWVRAFPDHSVGILCGRCLAYDIDHGDPKIVKHLEGIAAEIFGGQPLVRLGQRDRRVLLYRAWEGVATAHYNGADIIGSGAMFVGFGMHPLGMQYRWLGDSPLNFRLQDLPVATPEGIAALNDWLLQTLGKKVGKQRPRNSTAAGRTSSTIDPVSGLICDGRDAVLANCIYNVWAAGERAPERIARLAFAQFQTNVEMGRPKRDGTEPWSEADALEKATYILRRGKRRPTPGFFARPRNLLAEAPAEIEQFNKAVSEICSLDNSADRLPRVADRLSRVMAGLATTGVCYATARTLAKWLDLNEDTVTRARSRLVRKGLWSREYDNNEVGGLARFRPEIPAALQFARVVVAQATRKSSVVVCGEAYFGSLKEQIVRNHDVGFEFLASNPEDES